MSSASRPAPRALLRVAFLLFVAAIIAGGCRGPSTAERLQRFEFTSPHMGTVFTITLYAPDSAAGREGAEAAFRRVSELEERMSDYIADSELNRLREHPAGQPVPVSRELFEVLQRAQEIARISDGAFDVTVGPYVRLWRLARKTGALPSVAELERAGRSVGWKKVRLDSERRTVTLLEPDMRLDLGGIGKGYAADQALLVLKGRGLSRALVAASGDIAAGDPPPGEDGWRIGIAPIDARPGQLANTVLLRNAGISTSGDTEQFMEIDGVRYSHDLNPFTGLGLTNRIQATVVAADATASDALCKPVCVLGKDRGLALADRLPGVAVLVISKGDGTNAVTVSSRWKLLARPR